MKLSAPTVLLFTVAISLTGLAFNAAAELSEAEAREYLKRGAPVVDVRTAEEFAAKRLTNTINIPLDDVKTRFPVTFTNKSEAILLHCRSGRRSGIAVGQLRTLGYTNVHNLGSYEQAQKALKPAKH